MKYFFCIIFLALNLTICAQNGFEFSSLLQNNQTIINIIETKNHNYIVTSIIDTINNQALRFTKLTENGNTITTQFYQSDSLSRIFSSNLFELTDNTYLTIGIGRTLNQNEDKIWLGYFDQSFTLIEELLYKFPVENTKIFTLTAILLNETVLAFSGNLRNGNDFPIYGGYFDFNLKSFTVNVNETYEDALINDFIKRQDSIGYILFGSNELFFADSLFNIEREVSHPTLDNGFSIFQQGNIHYYTDSTILLSAKYYGIDDEINMIENEERGIVVGIFNFNLEVLQFDTLAISSTGDTINWPATIKSISINEMGNFYLGGTYNLDFSDFNFGNTDSKFLLAKYELSLSKLWEKKYGGSAYYFMAGILATSDGGCIMYGHRYKSDTRLEAYALKVDGEGLITNTLDLPLAEESVYIYPNPFRENLQVELKSNSQLELVIYDSFGKTVLKKTISDMKTYINVTTLENGMYFFQILKKGLLLHSGQLVKL